MSANTSAHSVCRTCGKKISTLDQKSWYSHDTGTSCWKEAEHQPIHTVFGEGLKSSPSTAPSHLLNVKLFRGLGQRKPETPLGIHWSDVSGIEGADDPQKSFYRGQKADTVGRGASMFASGSGRKGEKFTIVHGEVNENAIIDKATSEGRKFAGRHQIWQGFPEYEETVRPGANVKVTGLTRIRTVTDSKNEGFVDGHYKYTPPKTKTRKITYKKPRQVQA